MAKRDMRKISIGLMLIFGAMITAAGVSFGEQQGSTSLADATTAIGQDKTTERMPLQILYVGIPDTERQKDFVSFLSQHFSDIKTADVGTFQEEQTKNSDVVILDKDGIEWGSRGETAPLSALSFSEHYSRATISLGIPGAFWADRQKLKPGYR
jgi:hypothetical protein